MFHDSLKAHLCTDAKKIWGQSPENLQQHFSYSRVTAYLEAALEFCYKLVLLCFSDFPNFHNYKDTEETERGTLIQSTSCASSRGAKILCIYLKIKNTWGKVYARVCTMHNVNNPTIGKLRENLRKTKKKDFLVMAFSKITMAIKDVVFEVVAKATSQQITFGRFQIYGCYKRRLNKMNNNKFVSHQSLFPYYQCFPGSLQVFQCFLT